ncbi:UDP-N-acetylenolpyruvoylglucosamine reductase [Granulicella tundricola MP5ACTX9]|uniref:UDP-N-acetylenolpyruvoylglucosamine reductase n=1 Tax=Granulicella tundricola (strain ATCC BAA-1859 / DSM 23138 / MP5ACTX9) TaxID=1198114 RepID=E8WZE2_GRATM|nr:UDP-N-acetylenolpyruvoylglucosamine reductase [Granulicella tundricola MP5ACTX9]
MQIEQNIPLAPYTTLRIGGPARYFAQATTEADLIEAITFARTNDLPLFILGGGSNLLVSDAGFPGLVLQAALAPNALHIAPPINGEITYTVPAGYDWDAFVLATSQAGLTGIESLAGIPGMVGGSPVQNIGAYGQEVSQTISAVHALDLETLTPRTFSREDCGFAYRTSIFNSTHRNRYIITAVEFTFALAATPTLTYADLKKHFAATTNPTPLEIYEAVRAIRRTKGMLILPTDAEPDFRSAGSFFKNPIVPAATLNHIAVALSIAPEKIPHWPTGPHEIKLPAAWLIEQAGFPKGFTQGNAAISTCHTLALVNHSGQATCADLLALRDTITQKVQSLFEIPLHQEPVYLS